MTGLLVQSHVVVARKKGAEGLLLRKQKAVRGAQVNERKQRTATLGFAQLIANGLNLDFGPSALRHVARAHKEGAEAFL